MEQSSYEQLPATSKRVIGGGQAAAGIRWPRVYDLVVILLARGRRGRYHDAVLDRSGIRPGDSVLDLGCGTGTQAVSAARRVGPGGSVVGVDISAEMVSAARRKSERAGLEISFERADAAVLPFEDATFDVVTMTTVMHMLPAERHRTCLVEAKRVLKAGGRFLVVDYSEELGQRSGWVSKVGMHGRFDLRELRDPLADMGFADIEYGPLDWLGLYYLRGTKVGESS
jgi:ubiquinone/menaquinone biosynthesis C-methylase UbiE